MADNDNLAAFLSSPRTGESPPTPPALDIANGLTSGAEGTLAWGIMGAGRVSHDFVQALKSVKGAKVVAVGASAISKAEEFGDKHEIVKKYGSYEELVADPEVQVVYIGTLHAFHREHTMLALDAGKHVLVEKPIACTGKDAEAMAAKAKERGLFLVEGMWTRFFPVVEMARHLVTIGVIGKVVALQADFGFNSSDSEEYPESPFFQHALGGGGLLFVGVYPISMATFCFGTNMPKTIAAAGIKDEPTGVDLSGGITLEYEGKGNISERLFDYKLPDPPASVEATGGFNYPNSNGFQYEAAAVQRCVLSGLKETPQFTVQESLVTAKIMDEVRRQLGVKDAAGPSRTNGGAAESKTNTA